MKQIDLETARKKLQKLDVNWSLPGDQALHRVFAFDDFKQALAFVNKIGELAETANHHPDITLSYGKVEVTLTTHSEGGLTNKDFQLAASIEELQQSGT